MLERLFNKAGSAFFKIFKEISFTELLLTTVSDDLKGFLFCLKISLEHI